jgi:hypothetical protein
MRASAMTLSRRTDAEAASCPRVRRSWRTPDALVGADRAAAPARKAPPARVPQPARGRPPRDGRDLLPLRTGCQWNALSATGLCSSSSAHRRFPGVARGGRVPRAVAARAHGVRRAEGIDWRWLAADGAMTKAPLGGENHGRNPTDRGKQGTKRSVLTDASGVPLGVAVAGRNRHDVMLLEATLASIVVPRPRPTARQPQGVCLDKAYDITGCTGCSSRRASRRTCAGSARSRPRAAGHTRAALGRRAHTQLDEPLPRAARALGQGRRRTTRARCTSRVRTSPSRGRGLLG